MDINTYLGAIKRQLRLAPDAEGSILRELRGHLQDSILELQGKGRSYEEAARSAIQSMGLPQLVARELYESHSQGAWFEAAIAAGPHLALALLFAFHGWQSPFWLALTYAGIVLLTLRGCASGRPVWAYPLVGYSILPLLAPGLIVFLYAWQGFGASGGLLPHLPSWGWALLLPSVLVTVWAFGSIVIRTVKRDWALVTLMVLPLPVLASWLLVLASRGVLISLPDPALHDADGIIALALLALALGSGCFVRLRPRRLKVAALLATAFPSCIIIAQSSPQDMSTWGLATVALLILTFLLSPALLQTRAADKGGAPYIWDDPGHPADQSSNHLAAGRFPRRS